MKSLLEALSDDGLTGTLTWMFDGTFDVSLGAKQYSCTSASECAAWLQRVSGRNDPEDLYLIQVLHNAEFSGSLSWSRNGFLSDETEGRRHALSDVGAGSTMDASEGK